MSYLKMSVTLLSYHSTTLETRKGRRNAPSCLQLVWNVHIAREADGSRETDGHYAFPTGGHMLKAYA